MLAAMPRLASDPTERELTMPLTLLPSPLRRRARVELEQRMSIVRQSAKSTRSAARRRALAPITDLEEAAMLGPVGLLQPYTQVPGQRRLPQPRQLLVEKAQTVSLRLAAARVLTLILPL